MRTRVVWLMAALMIGLAASAPSQAQQVTNLLTNGGFESGEIGPYGTYGTAPPRSSRNAWAPPFPKRRWRASTACTSWFPPPGPTTGTSA